MDYWQRIKTKLGGIYIYKVGIRPTVDTAGNGSQSGKDLESQARPYLAEPIVNDEIRAVQNEIQGLNDRVVSNVLALLDNAAQIHQKNPMAGHQIADRVLLQIINNDKITKAFRKCC